MDSDVLDGRYRLGAVLGRGGMADVFRADDLTLGRAVAVKLFRFTGDDQSDRIDAEMRTLASLNHPGLVTLYDARFDERPYLVMELVDGPTLRSAGRAFEPDEVFRFAAELADSLAYVHSRGVVHRDIKPGNVLLGTPRAPGAEYSMKLADFGIARFLDSARLTAHGSTVGTAHYISPEQALGRPVTPASDVYSLGLVLIECQTGRMVFGGDAVAAAVSRLHRDPEVPSSWGPAWSALLTQMTSREPEARPTAAEVSRALARANSADTMVLPVAQRTSQRRLVIAGAAAVVVAAIVGGIALTRGPEAEVSVPSVQPATTTVQPVEPVPAVAPAPTLDSTGAVEAPAPVTAPVAVPEPAVVPEPVVVESAPTVPTVPNGNGNGRGNGNGSGNGNGNGGNGNNGNGNGK